MKDAMHPVLTIGHSTHAVETFIGLLRMHGVKAIGDVRSRPFSRLNPQFNQENLQKILQENGIRYVFLGRELGARSQDPTCYQNGRVQYGRLAATESFKQGLERVIAGSFGYRIALMCAEKEPLECHRSILVSRALAERGVPVFHIHADGRLESHAAAMERLLDLARVPKQDLFRSHQELLAEAITRQERNIAYTDETASAPIREERR